MDSIVIVLIGAGVCCFMIGVVLFLKLCKTTPDDEKKELLDPEYAENFSESFKNTGSIEGTLEELSSIYTDNQYMYNLIVNALEYIRDGQGDYETALESINVDGNIDIMKLHSTAIRKALGVAVKEETEETVEDLQGEQGEIEEDEEEIFEEDEVMSDLPEKKQTKKEIESEVFEETEHEDDLNGFKIG